MHLRPGLRPGSTPMGELTTPSASLDCAFSASTHCPGTNCEKSAPMVLTPRKSVGAPKLGIGYTPCS